jgi:hypothetical protein
MDDVLRILFFETIQRGQFPAIEELDSRLRGNDGMAGVDLPFAAAARTPLRNTFPKMPLHFQSR